MWLAASIVCAVCGALSVVFTKAALFVGVATLVVGLVSSSSLTGTLRTRAMVAIAIAAVASTIGALRFTITQAAPGVVEAGQNDQIKDAVYKLREIRVAQDAMRSYAFIDPDHDGIGSAGSLAQMAGTQAVASGVLPNPPLHPRFGRVVEGAHGAVSVVDNYCFAVFVPPSAELAERRYVAYAWPKDAPVGHLGVASVLFLDEHERIFETNNTQGYVGVEHMPTWDAALARCAWDADPSDGAVAVDGAVWTAWRHKQPLTQLKGDRALR